MDSSPERKRTHRLSKHKTYDFKKKRMNRSIDLDKVSEEENDEEEDECQWAKMQNNLSCLLSSSMILRYERAMKMRPDRI